jgi:precorrin-6Y C5,15-methyltransferase (decarboxylating)
LNRGLKRWKNSSGKGIIKIMKELTIVGAGLGPESLSVEGMKALEAADVWFGAERLLGLYGAIRRGKKAFPYYRAEAIQQEIEQSPATRFAVLVSGDPGFYSAASSLVKALAQYNPRVIPGISSLNAFFARLGIPWENAALVSAHGRDINAAACEFAALVRRNRCTFCLAGSNVSALGQALCAAGFGAFTIHVGENLGSSPPNGGANERVYTLDGAALARAAFPELTVLLAINENPDDRVLHGIPDSAFIRAEGIPMTKAAVRSFCLAQLALASGEIAWDIGAGTGSVSVEMALAAFRGRVFAAEREEEAIALIRENCERFHVGNVTPIQGEAPGILAELPAPDAVFIGGSGGSENLKAVIAAARNKNPRARIVATAITIETASTLLAALPAASLFQISVAEGRKAGSSHLLAALNPVMIISDNGKEA